MEIGQKYGLQTPPPPLPAEGVIEEMLAEQDDDVPDEDEGEPGDVRP